ncbi:MAG: hypothetical protein RJB26_447 [Pseudomonadota bacterium]
MSNTASNRQQLAAGSVAWPAALLAALLCVPLGIAHGAEPTGHTMYRWRDAQGRLQTGDSVPPEYSSQDIEVLNSRGVVVGTREGARSPAQRAAVESRLASEAAARQAVLRQRQRDQNLLATYLTVEEIQLLRDRRLDLIDGQLRVATQYLETLRARLLKLQGNAANFRPYNGKTTGPAIPPGLAEDLVRTMNDVQTQERNLATKREDFRRISEEFARDITRFRELKRLEKDYGPGGYLRLAPEAAGQR